MYRKVDNRQEFLNKVKEQLPTNTVCLEIGVYEGIFPKMMYNTLQPSKLFLIDPFDEVKVTKVTKETTYVKQNNHKIVYSTSKQLVEVENLLKEGLDNGRVSIDKNLSTDTTFNYKKNYFDFIYIDACHLYECVKWDMENYLPKLKSGGLMGGHDYGDNSFGVTQAVDEFCEKYGYEIQLLCTYQGDWLLTPKKGVVQPIQDIEEEPIETTTEDTDEIIEEELIIEEEEILPEDLDDIEEDEETF